MPFRWQISMVVGVESTLAVLPLESTRLMLLMVSEKASSWSLGASVISTGTDTAGALPVPFELDAGELEQPAMRPAVRMKEEVRARRRVIRVVRTFMVVLRKATKIKAIRH